VHLSIRETPTKVLLVGVLAVLLLVTVSITSCGGPAAVNGQLSAGTLGDVPVQTPLPPVVTTPPPTTAPPSPSPSAKPRTTTTRPVPRTTTTTTTAAPAWLVASGGTGVVGPGSRGFIRYRVEVEPATGVSAASVASVVDSTLAGSRGWTNEGWSFQRVASGAVDMVVRVATQGTVDRLCNSVGSQVSCRNGQYVVLHVNRWKQGVPDYAGDVASYRILVVNHEVGHRLGHAGHPKCPGPGMPEPVMMQVYFEGLAPCVKNVWPYAEDGTYIG
jgi:hypothetical protein